MTAIYLIWSWGHESVNLFKKLLFVANINRCLRAVIMCIVFASFHSWFRKKRFLKRHVYICKHITCIHSPMFLKQQYACTWKSIIGNNDLSYPHILCISYMYLLLLNYLPDVKFSVSLQQQRSSYISLYNKSFVLTVNKLQ